MPEPCTVCHGTGHVTGPDHALLPCNRCRRDDHDVNTYDRGCRCEPCRNANADRLRKLPPRPLVSAADLDFTPTRPGTAPLESPEWMTSAHSECYEIEATSVIRGRTIDGPLVTVVRWPCTLEVEVKGVEVRTDEYDRLHDVALAMKEKRSA